MNFTELNNKEYLNNVSHDFLKLNELITSTNGYILYKMSKYGIYPSLELLLENVNPYALHFIANNYDLTKEQTKSLKSYFNPRVDNKIVNEILTQEEIKDFLIEGQDLPLSTILTYDIISEYVAEINQQSKKMAYNMSLILEQSIANISLEDFLKIDRSILKTHINLFNHIKQFENEIVRNLYKELVIEKATESNKPVPVHLENFVDFNFKNEDKDFFLKLLNMSTNEYHLTAYEMLQNMSGATNLISKRDFFLEYNSENIESFSIEEIIEYKAVIQEKWLAELREDKSYPYSINKIINKKANKEQFIEIMTKDFFNEIMNLNAGKIHFNSVDDYNDGKFKKQYVLELMTYYAIENASNDEILLKLPFDEILNEFYRIVENGEIDNIDQIKGMKDFYLKVVPQILMTHNLHNISFKSGLLVNNNSLPLIDELIEQRPSINLLIELMSIYNHTEKNEYKKRIINIMELEKQINILSQKLNEKDVMDCAKYYNISLDLKNEYKNEVSNDFEYNFLNYNTTNIQEIDDDILLDILKIKPDFQEFILTNKIELSSTLLINILNHTNESKFLDFITRYVKLHESLIAKDSKFIEAILQHKHGLEIYQVDNETYQKSIFESYLEKLKEKKNINQELEEIYKKLRLFKCEDEKDIEKLSKIDRASYKKLNEYKIVKDKELNDVTEYIRKTEKGFSYTFKYNQMTPLINAKRFEDISLMYDGYYNKDMMELFYTYVNQLDFNTLLKNIDDNYFSKMMVSAVNNEDCSINLSKFNDKENMIIAEILYPKLNSDKPQKIFNLFSDDKLFFAKEFAIKCIPTQIFYSYDFIMRKTKKEGKKSIPHFTKEEVLKAYYSLEKQGGFFSYTDINAQFDHFFDYNFEDNEKEYLELVEIAKNESPKLYTLLTTNKRFIDVHDKSKEKVRKTRDESQMYYFKEHFDLDVVLKGIEEILNEMKNHTDIFESKFNKKLASLTIDQIVWKTMYDQYDKNNVNVYYSSFSTEESVKIIDKIFNIAPLYLLSLSRIGNVFNMGEYLQSKLDIHLENSNKDILSLLYPESQTQAYNFNLNVEALPEEDRFSQHVFSYLNSIINHCLHKEKFEELEYMYYLVNHNNFIEKELKYEYQKNDRTTYSGLVNYMANNSQLKEKLSTISSKYHLENLLEVKDKKVKKNRKI